MAHMISYNAANQRPFPEQSSCRVRVRELLRVAYVNLPLAYSG